MGNFGWFNSCITAAAENLTNQLVSKSDSQTNATEEMVYITMWKKPFIHMVHVVEQSYFMDLTAIKYTLV